MNPFSFILISAALGTARSSHRSNLQSTSNIFVYYPSASTKVSLVETRSLYIECVRGRAVTRPSHTLLKSALGPQWSVVGSQ